MIFRFSPAIFAASFCLISLSAQAQNFGVVIDSAEAKKGEIVCLPVHAQGFFGIVGYQYSLEFNEQVMTFHHTQNYNLPDMGGQNFNMYLPGVLTTAWTDPEVEGVSRENGLILYEVCFTAVGNVGSSTNLTPGGTLPPDVGGAGVYDLLGNNLWNLDNNVPGLVEITLAAGTSDVAGSGKSDLQLSPNPSAAATPVKVQFYATQSKPATLSVSDALGRIIFEQKIAVKTGENNYEIPAKSLNAKGMYQVSIKTDQSVSTQMLSVN